MPRAPAGYQEPPEEPPPPPPENPPPPEKPEPPELPGVLVNVPPAVVANESMPSAMPPKEFQVPTYHSGVARLCPAAAAACATLSKVAAH
jgi:hypothetical protein